MASCEVEYCPEWNLLGENFFPQKSVWRIRYAMKPNIQGLSFFFFGPTRSPLNSITVQKWQNCPTQGGWGAMLYRVKRFFLKLWKFQNHEIPSVLLLNLILQGGVAFTFRYAHCRALLFLLIMMLTAGRRAHLEFCN